jgi:hypothetical protein
MAPIGTGRTNDERQSTWEPPAVKKVAIGAETKSAAQGEATPGLAEPRPPSSPATKLGFSFEMAFPLAARTTEK